MRGTLIVLQMRRWFTTSRRKVFGFGPLNYDKSVTLTDSQNCQIEIPLEAHPIGSHGPSLIPFNRDLLDVLACPISGDSLKYDEERNVLVSERIGVAFPINKAGMPIFLKKWAIMDA